MAQGDVGQIIQGVGQGLQMLTKIFGSQDPAAGQAMGEVTQHFVQVIDQIKGGGSPQQSQVPMEQGANGAQQTQQMRG